MLPLVIGFGPRGVKNKTKQKNGRSWLALAGFEAQKCTFFVFPFSYISDPTKLIEYMSGTVGWYSNHQNKHCAGFGVLGVFFFKRDFLKILTGAGAICPTEEMFDDT